MGSHYRTLGIVKHFSTQQVKWAYEQQVNNDPNNQRHYLKALEDIASLRQNEELQTEVALILSQLDQVAPLTLDEAYRTISIDPAHAAQLSDEIIIDRYNCIKDTGTEADKRSRMAALKFIQWQRDSKEKVGFFSWAIANGDRKSPNHKNPRRTDMFCSFRESARVIGRYSRHDRRWHRRSLHSQTQ